MKMIYFLYDFKCLYNFIVNLYNKYSFSKMEESANLDTKSLANNDDQI
jgi:hypothetical protein